MPADANVSQTAIGSIAFYDRRSYIDIVQLNDCRDWYLNWRVTISTLLNERVFPRQEMPTFSPMRKISLVSDRFNHTENKAQIDRYKGCWNALIT